MFKKGMIPQDSGILIPKTKDGRVLFVINYLGHPMVGTTDEKCELTHYCEPTEKEIEFIFKELEPYFGSDYDFKGNLMSAWAGIRPLVMEKELSAEEQAQHKKNSLTRTYLVPSLLKAKRWWTFKTSGEKKESSSETAKLSRSHVIEVSDSGLISLMGGKWTSFRHMGQETVDKIQLLYPGKFDLKHETTNTKNFSFIGSYSRLEAVNGMQLST